MSKRRLIEADQASVFMEMMSVHISSGLVLHQMTSDHNRSELGIQDHNNEQSSSKLHAEGQQSDNSFSIHNDEWIILPVSSVKRTAEVGLAWGEILYDSIL
ncbi:hypothetical protein Tco_1193117 [Tanacetum coccineum]